MLTSLKVSLLLLSYQRYGTVMNFSGIGLFQYGKIARTLSPL